MSQESIHTPADLLRLTHDFEDRQYAALLEELGEEVLLQAAIETEKSETTEASDIEDIEDSDETDSPELSHDIAPTPALLVAEAKERFARKYFDLVQKSPIASDLYPYRIARVSPGLMILTTEGLADPPAHFRGHFTISGRVEPVTMTLGIESTYTDEGVTSPRDPIPADSKLVFDAATWLQSVLGTR